MIDTIVLTIDADQFEIINHNNFHPPTYALFHPPYYFKNIPFISFTQNPSKADIANGIYKPRLTIIKRIIHGGFSLCLNIEFSIPKLILGNNFLEVDESDFQQIINKLNFQINEMGVLINEEAIKKAQVSSIHYSKNILLDKHTFPSMIISELSKINLNKSLDLSQTIYRNEGHALHFKSNNFDLVFYDKIRDMQQARLSEKRAIESDNAIQYSILKTLGNLQVIRMEVRLGSRKRIKFALKKIDQASNLEFSQLFKVLLSKAILLYYWQHFTSRLIYFLFDETKPEDIFKALLSNKNNKTHKSLKYTAILMLINSIGFRQFRNLLENNASNRTWQTINKELKSIKINKQFKYLVLKNISDQLTKFDLIKTI